MDTSGFDEHAKQHLKIYKNFMLFSKIAIITTIVVLVMMAITLL